MNGISTVNTVVYFTKDLSKLLKVDHKFNIRSKDSTDVANAMLDSILAISGKVESEYLSLKDAKYDYFSTFTKSPLRTKT